MSSCAYNSGRENKCLHPSSSHKPHCPHINEEKCEFFSDHHIDTCVGVTGGRSSVSTQVETSKGVAKSEESLEKNVNHPKRYTKGKIECIDALEAAVAGKSPDEAIYVANVIKYLWRYEEKEPLRSLMSAQWYLGRVIKKIQGKEVAQ